MDRNRDAGDCATAQTASLSARRAWIEIFILQIKTVTGCVALRKESVDRNNRPDGKKHINSVALRKESVDRNSKIAKKVLTSTCRSPQGERG